MQTKLFIKTVKLFESISDLDLYFRKKRGYVPSIGWFLFKFCYYKIWILRFSFPTF